LKNPRRKKRDPKIVQVIGKLVDLMLGKVFITKYCDPRTLVVTVYINNTFLSNTLIDLGETSNVGNHGKTRATQTLTYPKIFSKWPIDPPYNYRGC